MPYPSHGPKPHIAKAGWGRTMLHKVAVARAIIVVLRNMTEFPTPPGYVHPNARRPAAPSLRAAPPGHLRNEIGHRGNVIAP